MRLGWLDCSHQLMRANVVSAAQMLRNISFLSIQAKKATNARRMGRIDAR